jgi:prepilin-type N-terminal cleavage/methylation domain-containing protein
MNSKKGFTFIEMLVVMVIISLALPALFSIVFGVLQQQTKILRLAEIKRQGDYALSSMTSTIRNYAISTHSGVPPTIGGGSNEVCSGVVLTPTPVAAFRDKYTTSSYFQYGLSGTKIASTSSVAGTSGDLTSANVVITNFSISCTRPNAASLPIIGVGFTISYNAPQVRAEEVAELYYQTSVKLRNAPLR